MSVSPVGWLVDGRSIMFDSEFGTFAFDRNAATLDDIRGLDAAGQVRWSSPYVQAWFATSFSPGAAAGGVASSSVGPSSRSPQLAPKQRLGGLPVWGWVLMWVFLWPIAMTWALVAMWREKRLTQTARIVWTTAVAAILIAAALAPPSELSEPQQQPAPAASTPATKSESGTVDATQAASAASTQATPVGTPNRPQEEIETIP
ncbi:MAG: hypothetical protein HGB10_03495 [Coriobacteriia bacterium]|nr:hypothetical protein [Coriobacteriia bacterium]